MDCTLWDGWIFTKFLGLDQPAVVERSKTLSFFGLLGGTPAPDEMDIPDPFEDAVEDDEGVAFVTFEELVGMREAAPVVIVEAVAVVCNAPDD